MSLLHPQQPLPWQLFGKLKDVAMETWFIFQALKLLGDVCTGRAAVLGSKWTCRLNPLDLAGHANIWLKIGFLYRLTIFKFASVFVQWHAIYYACLMYFFLKICEFLLHNLRKYICLDIQIFKIVFNKDFVI